MATTYPQGTFLPATFYDSSPDTATATLDLHTGALKIFDFTADAAGATTLFLTYVIFDYPNATNAAATPPAPPVVEMLMAAAGALPPGFDATGFTLVQTGLSGTQSLPVPGGAANYDYTSLGGGVFQIRFTTNDVAFSALQWFIRFTITDGATNATHQKALTFVVDGAATKMPWLAVPGQLNLTPSGPVPLEFGTALKVLTLSGPGVGSAKQLIAGKTYTLDIPIGNYGTAPLTVTGVTPAAVTNGFSLQLPAPLTIPPGSTNAVTLQASFAAPAAGQTGVAAQATPFALASNDVLASGAAPTHFNSVSLYASAGNLEIVLVLDLSGSMATVDAGPMSRWAALQAAVGQVGTQMLSFATGPNNKFAAVVYPSPNGTSVGQIALPAGPVHQSRINALAEQLSGFAPVDSTPLAGTSAAPGGIYTAMGKPANPATDSGVFLGSTDPGFARNFRWMVLMTDGVSNVGDDPGTIASTYFTSRRVGVITVGYGKPSGGQVNFGVLKALANASLGTSSANPANFFSSDPSGQPSQQITMTFEKSVAGSLGLQFAVDPNAVVAPGAENRHSVVITEFDQSALFTVCVVSGAEMESLQVSLLTPSGELVTDDSADQFGITPVRSTLSRGFFAGAKALEGGSARHGTWTLIVAGAPSRATTAAPSLEYAYSVSVDSALSLDVSADSPASNAGDDIGIVAALSLQGRPLLGAHVTATITATGQGFDNWLAAQPVSQAEYIRVLRSLEGQRDVQAIFIKTKALANRGIFFPGAGSTTTQTLSFDARTGTYRTSFPATTLPGSYGFLVTATGKDELGNPFTRQQTWQTHVTPQLDAASTLVTISYQIVSNQMQATLQVWPRDRFGNVLLVDPAFSSAIQILLSGGAVASGPLRWNLDASYTQIFTYPLGGTPSASVLAGPGNIIAAVSPPDLGKFRFVDTVVRFTPGREATTGANTHADANQALGDPSRRPATSFVSLGGKGSAVFAMKRGPVTANSVTVFVAADTSLRPYAVLILPVQAGIGWIEVGRSLGVTKSFRLVPRLRRMLDTSDWLIEVEGKLAGMTFDAKIPLAGRLHLPFDPISRIGATGIAQIMIADLSGTVSNPDGTASASPGISVQAIGFPA